ncbi:MAG: hypothetical protein JOZ87_00855 [Chloroflexi bacterium]|nr:hypothetical protein [Chloroflexota bacterium]
MTVLTISPRRVDLGGGHFMVTTAELDTDKQVASFTEWMTCTNKVAGFTGGILLTYFDDNNNVIGNSGVQQNGIGQAPLFGAGHRTITWNDQVPAGVHSFVLSQFHDPHTVWVVHSWTLERLSLRLLKLLLPSASPARFPIL